MNRAASAPSVPETRLLNRATISAALLAGVIFVIDVQRPARIRRGHALRPAAARRHAGRAAAFPVRRGRRRIGAGRRRRAARTAGRGSWFAYTTRGIALLVIWTTAIVLGRFRRTWLELQARTADLQMRTKDLADVNFALDQVGDRRHDRHERQNHLRQRQVLRHLEVFARGAARPGSPPDQLRPTTRRSSSGTCG